MKDAEKTGAPSALPQSLPARDLTQPWSRAPTRAAPGPRTDCLGVKSTLILPGFQPGTHSLSPGSASAPLPSSCPPPLPTPWRRLEKPREGQGGSPLLSPRSADPRQSPEAQRQAQKHSAERKRGPKMEQSGQHPASLGSGRQGNLGFKPWGAPAEPFCWVWGAFLFSWGLRPCPRPSLPV